MPLGLENPASSGQRFGLAPDIWEVIVKYHGDLSKLSADLNAQVELLSERYAIITLRQSEIPLLNDYSEIEHIELPKELTFVLQQALMASCISPVQDEALFGLTGRGVIVGIIDSGIDYTHPDFQNDDGSSRILSIWDQTGTGVPPAGFSEGAEYSEAQINAALASGTPFEHVPEMDALGHGTAVAGVAAGNGRASRGRINKGAATEASLIAVRLGRRGQRAFALTTEIMRALKYIVDKAEQLNMPVAINLSYGTNDGSHSGDSLFETYITDLAQRWKTAIIAASGNEAVEAHHYAGRLQTNEEVAIIFSTTGGLSSFYLTLWKDFADEFTVELILPNGMTTGPMTYEGGSRTFTFFDRVVFVDFGQPSHYSVQQNIFFRVEAIEGALPAGQWQLRIKAGNIVDGSFNIWLPITEEVTRNTAFASPSVETTLTLPSTAFKVISVGAYNSLLNSIASFSGRGYTNTQVSIKPDLVAPGVDILAPKRNGGYDVFTGTSIAAPFVTGAAALMMQWGIVEGRDPFLYGERVKAFLRRGANRQKGIEYPNPYWGYGTLCLRNSMMALIQS
ncbi:MAG: PII-type proteinase precursor [Firmicutes bacterium ADurb.Bin356]|nr:MAG: PII-type proteinase precursor [Firmicutes bacterium ADurb.Bin356]